MNVLIKRPELLLVFLFSSLPFVFSFHLPPIPSYFNEVVAVLLAFLLLFSCFVKFNSISIPRDLTFLISFVVVLVLAFGAEPLKINVVVVLFASWCALVSFKTYMEFSPDATIDSLLLGCLIGGVVNATFGWFNLFGLDFSNYFPYIAATGGIQGVLGQANLFALYLFIAMLALLELNFRCCINRVFFGVLILFMGLVSATTTSRTVFLYLISLLGASVFSFYRHDFNRFKYYVFFVVGYIVAMVLAQYYGISHKVAIYRGLDDWSALSRLVMIQQGLQIWKDYFFFGVGFMNSAGVSFSEYFLNSRLDPRVPLGHTHNIFIQFALEFGLVGLGALGLFIYSIIRDFKNTKISVLLALILMFFLCLSMLEYPLWYANFLLLFFAFCGASVANAKVVVVKFNNSKLAIAISVMSSVLAIYCMVGYFELAIHSPEESTFEERFDFVNRVIHREESNRFNRWSAQMHKLPYVQLESNYAGGYAFVHSMRLFRPTSFILWQESYLLKKMGRNAEADKIDLIRKAIY